MEQLGHKSLQINGFVADEVFATHTGLAPGSGGSEQGAQRGRLDLCGGSDLGHRELADAAGTGTPLGCCPPAAATTATPWAREGDLNRIGKFVELVKAQGIMACLCFADDRSWGSRPIDVCVWPRRLTG